MISLLGWAGDGNLGEVSKTKASVTWDSVVWMGVGACCSGLGSAWLCLCFSRCDALDLWGSHTAGDGLASSSLQHVLPSAWRTSTALDGGKDLLGHGDSNSHFL